MPLTAVVKAILPGTSLLPGKSPFDEVRLDYNGFTYYIETPRGLLTLEQIVNVKAVDYGGNGVPLRLELIR